MINAYRFSSVSGPLFQEGLYLSSPAFWQEIQRTGRAITGDEKSERSYAKYWLRSSTRCTPYGTFAGSTMVNIGAEETSLVLNPDHTHYRSRRIDMNFLTELAAGITNMPAIIEQIKFFVNNSLYEVGDSLRYAEYTIRDNTRHYHLSAVERSEYLTRILDRAENGATIGELQMVIMASQAVPAEEAREFVLQLWRSQLLIPETEPCVTGTEPLTRLIAQVSSLKGTDELAGRLQKISCALADPQAGVASYLAIEKELAALDLGFGELKDRFQTDLFLSAQEPVLNHALVDTLVSQVSDLEAIARRHINPDLENFKSIFNTRYEGAAIPLNIALDGDIGIGYAGVHDDAAGRGPLVDDLPLAGPARPGQVVSDYITQFVLQKFQDQLQHRKPCIELTEEELQECKRQTASFTFPASMYLMGSLLKKDGQLTADRFSFDLSAFSGPSAANLLGRFTHGDPQILHAAKEILRQEESQDPDAIYAEIVHLPQARIGNVLLRPVLRSYELPYVGRSGADPADQIHMNDLMVSIENNEVVLRSKKLDRRIIPRLTTAHNFSYRSLPVYKFLCDLQGQGLAYPNAWDWGQLEILRHLPRVVYKNIILKKARWKMAEKDLKDLPPEEDAQKEFFRKRRAEWDMPAKLIYKENDNGLFIDLEERMGISVLLHYLRRYKTIVLEEALFTGENCVVRDANGDPFNNELIIPLYRTQPVSSGPLTTTAGQTRMKKTAIKRKFPPYSEWLYCKIYCGAKTGEKVLRELILPFVTRGLDSGLFRRFFFVRYRDEAPHLRIRFYNTEITRQLTVLKEMILTLQPFLDNGLIDSVVVDTYYRELERYGGDLIKAGEKIFHNDSLAALQSISLLEEDEGKYRLVLALRSIDIFLDDFGLSLEEKADLLRQMASSFFKEFGGRLELQRQLNDKYRKVQSFLFTHMDSSRDELNEIAAAISAFAYRSEMNAGVVQEIRSAFPDGDRQGLYRLLTSYIHMNMNRIFVAQPRKYELVVYHFLDKFLASKIAIANNKKKKTANDPVTAG